MCVSMSCMMHDGEDLPEAMRETHPTPPPPKIVVCDIHCVRGSMPAPILLWNINGCTPLIN